MATIRKRQKKDGAFSYQVEIVIKKHGIIVHRESKTFSKQKLAKDWGMRRETELQNQTVYKTRKRLPMVDLIELYIKEFQPSGRTKLADLKRIMNYEISNHDVHLLTSKELIEHTLWRNHSCTPQTANNDLIWMHTVLKTMSGTMNLNLNLSVFEQAREVLRKEGLIKKSDKRDRTLTNQEIFRLTRYLDEPTKICMWFAIYSSRRLSEITSLLWDDLDHGHRVVLVRGLKHPRIKNLSRKAKLPKSAYKLIMKQQKVSSRIFPYNPKTISSYFTRACKILGIDDLHFHDTRHHALTCLAIKGLSLPELQLISLHDGYSSLQRYINLKPENLDI